MFPMRVLIFLANYNARPLCSQRKTMNGSKRGKVVKTGKFMSYCTDFLICFQSITANSTTAGVQNLSTEQKTATWKKSESSLGHLLRLLLLKVKIVFCWKWTQCTIHSLDTRWLQLHLKLKKIWLELIPPVNTYAASSFLLGSSSNGCG